VKCDVPIETPATTLELVVETYDQNSSVKSALKTDTITLTVTPYVYPSLASDLVDITYDWQSDRDSTEATIVAGTKAIASYAVAISPCCLSE